MKYRHAFHAGNFADVHKHVTLLALIEAMQRKEKGFLHLDTHAGRGAYQLADPAEREAPGSIEALLRSGATSPELVRFVRLVTAYRSELASAHAYPGSPLIAARQLRAQDRAVFIEMQLTESRLLERALQGVARTRVECDDGFERLRAHLPPKERRGLVLIDPPYEETARDFERAHDAVRQVLARFETAVIALWYPIKRAADLAPWHAELARDIERPALLSELWLYPPDSRVSLNGSGLVIVNPPYRVAERMQSWLPELALLLDTERRGGMRVRWLTAAS
ncbi:MAG TPA: 23S rRNA (adenine(2030)-N(6))-methyltransferase RlmJ [Steroidobacteraceae bacterium]|nr:23S rRNA (adenine(2030)-N(6))-methyltransferase RlmJ [Steroidobacteraceae bacterium]